MTTSSGYQRVNGLRLWVHRFRDESAPPTRAHDRARSTASWTRARPGTWSRPRSPARATTSSRRICAASGRATSSARAATTTSPTTWPTSPSSSTRSRRGGSAIVGHSMGGTVAALYAGAHPDRVERLALLEGMGPMATEPLRGRRPDAGLAPRRCARCRASPKPLTVAARGGRAAQPAPPPRAARGDREPRPPPHPRRRDGPARLGLRSAPPHDRADAVQRRGVQGVPAARSTARRWS